jgi:hypothetical protein
MTRNLPPTPQRWLSPLIGLALVATLACGGSSGSAPTAVQAPIISSGNLASGRAGDTLILNGSGFQGTSKVLFGTLTAGGWGPSADGTQLEVRVPAGGTGTVTLSVTTPAGTSSDGPSFTFVAAPVPASNINPASGGPGTQVMVTGSQFIATDQLVFGATAVTSMVSTDGTTITAWAPDLASGQAPGPVNLSVQTVSAGAVNVGSFNLLAPRMAILAEPFVEVALPVPGITSRAFDYPSAQRTAQYGLGFPRVPVLHPYNPDQYGSDVRLDPATGSPWGAPRMTLSIQFPAAFSQALPASVLQQIRASQISLANVSIFCYTQNYFWDGSNPYEFRPHYFTDPDAPYTGAYDETSNVDLGLFEAEPGITLVDAQGSSFFTTPIVTHAEAVFPNLVVSSPDSLQMPGINTSNSTSFWSLVVDNGAAAATLHLLLNDADQAALEAIMDQTGPITIGTLAQELETRSLTSARVVKQVEALFGPVVNGALLGTAQAGSATLTLFGSGFSEATGVTAGTPSVPGTAFTVLSDSTIKATIPVAAAAQGNIIVTTASGASQPVALN